jgi:CBS domain-containing protein
MTDTGLARQVWIYIGEGDSNNGQSVAQQIFQALRDAGCPGATMLRGAGGYGTHNILHTDLAIEIASHLPLVITFIDRADRVERVLPALRALVREGMIAITPVEVVLYHHRAGGPFPRHLMVSDVMSRNVASVSPEAPLAEVVTLLIERGLRALPVLAPGGQVLGIITDGDLLSRGTTGLAVRLQRSLPISERAAQIDGLASQPQRAAELMTPNPETLSDTLPLAQAAAAMAAHNRKRMPVVDIDGVLVGMVSRYDLLTTVAEGMRQRPDEPLDLPAGAPATVGEMMLADPLAVQADAPIAEALDALLESPLRRAVVVDADRAVVGIITDGDVLRRAARRLPGGTLSRLAAWLSGGERPAELQVEGYGRAASDAMTSPVTTVREDAPVAEAIRLMMAHKVKALPVVDADGHLAGIVGRAGVLAALGGTL